MNRSGRVLAMSADLGPDWPAIGAPAGLTIRSLRDDDVAELGVLMLRAYAGVLDEAGHGIEDHVDVAARTMGGQFGPVHREASFAAVEAATPGLVGATVVTEWRGAPHLAFAMVDPGWQTRGVGAALVTRSGAALRDSGAGRWTLTVTRHNRAVHLYERLGFRESDPGLSAAGYGR